MIAGNMRLSLRGYNTQQSRLSPSPQSGNIFAKFLTKYRIRVASMSTNSQNGEILLELSNLTSSQGDAYKSNTTGGVGRRTNNTRVSKYSRKSWQIAKNGKFNISRKNIPRIFVDERCENNCGWKKLSANRGLEAWFFCHIMQVLRSN